MTTMTNHEAVEVLRKLALVGPFSKDCPVDTTVDRALATLSALADRAVEAPKNYSQALAHDDPIHQMRMVCLVARENDTLISRSWVNGWADQWEKERAERATPPAAPGASHE